MRFAAHFALLAIVSSASASLFARQDIPSCAASCLAKANTACALTNYSCLCNDKAFFNATNTCIISSCSASDVQTTETTAEDLCKAVGVILTTTATATATATSTATTTASTAASATSAQHSSGASLTSSSNLLVGIAVALAIATV